MIDEVWEHKYTSGHSQKYPWDSVVSFFFRYRRSIRGTPNIDLLEVGCGTGANLWFAAREGCNVVGIDGSSSAINAAKKLFFDEKLDGIFYVSDFTQIPCGDQTHDMVIDRGALTCCRKSNLPKALSEVARVIKPGGYFLFTPFSDSHTSSMSGTRADDGTIEGISQGTLVGVGAITFLSEEEIMELLPSDTWRIDEIYKKEFSKVIPPDDMIHAEWQIVAQRR